MKWRMPEKCANCPFASNGPGRQLRRSLHPGRWRQILRDLRNSGHFHCHKHIDVDPHKRFVCAGSIEYQDKIGVKSSLRQFGERVGLI